MTGRLFVVATPIGNLEDVTLRALRVLREANAVLAEDTRRTRVLLSHHGIGTPVRAMHAHTTDDKLAAFAAELAGGARYALVTDAGSPCISDPGSALTSRAAALGVPIESIPGPSAPIAALTASGFAVPTFRFVGFLPRSGGRRARALAEVAAESGCVVLFESPQRIAQTLLELSDACGATREAALCRELTKLHEEIARGTLASLAEQFGDGTLGEITLVIAPRHSDPDGDEEESGLDPAARARELLEAGLSPRDAAARLSREAGVPRREAYRLVLDADAPAAPDEPDSGPARE